MTTIHRPALYLTASPARDIPAPRPPRLGLTYAVLEPRPMMRVGGGFGGMVAWCVTPGGLSDRDGGRKR